ncbi:hypothetical protein SLEP1_g10324 [Rubroshorea leprosula]|uniref:Uncharacterized protein n=1 Tax=Rubroshorea leprosula TaxID=152421 RepID=A0AAV5IFP6_9ROSI|nr:hypothetical protein SLEP1_g10324 [Rubroshorea leprosula]
MCFFTVAKNVDLQSCDFLPAIGNSRIPAYRRRLDLCRLFGAQEELSSESKSTNDTSWDQPVLPVVSISTTSTAEATPSTPNVGEELLQ